MAYKDDDLKRVGQITGAGALSGATLAGLSGILGGANPKALLRRALIGGLIGGAAAPASQVTGEAIMGSPESREHNPFTRRGALGGAILGGVAGLAGTAALSGKLPLGKLGSFGEKAETALASDHAILNYLRKLAKDPSGVKQALAVSGGMGLGALGGLHMGADEGMGLDVMANEVKALQDERRKEQIRRGE